MKQRIVFWDNYKGLLIFLVVFGHFIYAYASNLDHRFVADIYTFIYTFHMPAFVFCSGYFSKSIRSRSTESIIKLLVCYIIFNTAMMLFAYFFLGSNLKLLTPYYSYWYIISLICWRLIIGSLETVRFLVPLSFLMTLLLGYWSEFSNVLSIRRTIAFFIFFAAGYLLNREKTETFILKRTWRTYALGIISSCILIPITFIIINKLDITSGMTMMATYKSSSDVFLRTLLLIIAFVAIIVLLLVTPNCNIPFFSQFGKNSLPIYLGHRFITIIFYKKMFPSDTYSNLYVVYALVATFITCIILGNEKVALHFNNAIGYISTSLLDQNSSLGHKLKSILFIGFLLCLFLRPLLN